VAETRLFKAFILLLTSSREPWNPRFIDLRFNDLRSIDLLFLDLRSIGLMVLDLRFIDLMVLDLRFNDLRFINLGFNDLFFIILFILLLFFVFAGLFEPVLLQIILVVLLASAEDETYYVK
jgi:hypothetical protein